MKRLAVLVALAFALVKPAHAVSAEKVYSSSHTASADTSASLATGRVELYKILVSSAGTGTALVTVKDVNSNTLTVLDATAVRDYTYEATVSTGLVYTTAGTIAPQVSFLYTRNLTGTVYGSQPSPYSVFYSSGDYTTRAIRTGRVFLKRIVVGKSGTAPASVTVYNSNATSTGPIIDIINAEAVKNIEYNVFVSSGLTYTSTGTPGVTFIYGNAR